MRQSRKSSEPRPSTLERMGGLEERSSEIGRARAEAERLEAQGNVWSDDRFPEAATPLEGKRRGRAGSHARAIRRPRRR